MSATTRGPPQPVYVLRGHDAQIHALYFYNENLRLLTGDADGWVVIWDMVSRRPIAVWRAHEKSILTLRTWGADKVITHGRDDALRVWHVPLSAESTLAKALPAEGYDIQRQAPWLLHSMLVNTMNFCALAICQDLTRNPATNTQTDEITLAVPGTQDGYVHIHQLPSEKCTHIVPPSSSTTKSLVMAIKLYTINDTLFLVAGNEAGETSVQTYKSNKESKPWTTIYSSRAHSQPILSLDIAPAQSRYFTSSADAVIASHPLPLISTGTSTSTSTASTTTPPNNNNNNTLTTMTTTQQQTGHAGQQSLCVRNDDRIFATAGWDARVRVYSAKQTTIKEVAVLKWHKEGCFAVAFGSVVESGAGDGSDDRADGAVVVGKTSDDDDGIVVKTGEQMKSLTVQQRREQNTRATHWLAAGSKDGKISLWNIF